MSGGGVFSTSGDLVAINSQHQEPLWDAQLRYSDESIVPREVEDFVGHYSAGISAKSLKKFIEPLPHIPFISSHATC